MATNQAAVVHWRTGEIPRSLVILDEILEDFAIDEIEPALRGQLFLSRAAVLQAAGRLPEQAVAKLRQIRVTDDDLLNPATWPEETTTDER